MKNINYKNMKSYRNLPNVPQLLEQCNILQNEKALTKFSSLDHLTIESMDY